MVFPYPKGFILTECAFLYYSLDIYGDLLFIYLVLNKWYKSTFFSQENGHFFFYFVGFQKKTQKEGRDT
jgi:hypothetical protein